MGARDASGRGGEVAGHSVARRHRARFGGSDRLRLPRAVDRSADQETPPGLGVRDGAAVLAAHVCPAGAAPGPARMDGSARRGLPPLRRRPAPAHPGQPQDRRRQARPLRPEDQQGVCRTRNALRSVGRSGPGGKAEGQAAGRAADALCPRLVLARPGVHLDRAHASRGRDLEPAGRRAAEVPAAGRGRPDDRVRRVGGGRTAASAADAVRAGPLVDGHGRPGHPHQGRPHPLLGSVEADRPPRRRPLDRHDGSGLPRRPARQDPRSP